MYIFLRWTFWKINKNKNNFSLRFSSFLQLKKTKFGQEWDIIILYYGLYHISTGGFIYDFYSRGIIGVIIYGHEINIFIIIMIMWCCCYLTVIFLIFSSVTDEDLTSESYTQWECDIANLYSKFFNIKKNSTFWNNNFPTTFS